MTDKELIQALREDAEWAKANEWETPITLGDNLAAAADRLEALSINRDAYIPAMTNADHIRAMSDFELMQFLWKLDSLDLGDVIKFCEGSRVCDELDVEEITEGMCQRCLLAQLQQPYESNGKETQVWQKQS